LSQQRLTVVAEDVPEGELDGFDAQVELGCYVAVGAVGDDQTGHRLLGSGETGQDRYGLRPRIRICVRIRCSCAWTTPGGPGRVRSAHSVTRNVNSFDALYSTRCRSCRAAIVCAASSSVNPTVKMRRMYSAVCNKPGTTAS
jgi:hypothetical protein